MLRVAVGAVQTLYDVSCHGLMLAWRCYDEGMGRFLNRVAAEWRQTPAAMQHALTGLLGTTAVLIILTRAWLVYPEYAPFVTAFILTYLVGSIVRYLVGSIVRSFRRRAACEAR